MLLPLLYNTKSGDTGHPAVIPTGSTVAVAAVVGAYGPGDVVNYRDSLGVDHAAVIVEVKVTDHLVDLRVWKQDGTQTNETDVDYVATRSTNDRWSRSYIQGQNAHTQVNDTVKLTG